MKKRSFDQIIQPVYGRTAFTDLLLFACRANHRITLDGNRRFLTRWEKSVTDSAYDSVIPARPHVCHELIRGGELIRGLGKSSYRAILPMFPQWAELPGGISIVQPYIVVYPGGSWKEKCWATDRFAAVCDWLAKRTKKRLLFCGGADDYETAVEIQKEMKLSKAVTIFAGEHDICQSFELIRHADLVFGNDTGAIHIAAVCRIPSVAIVVGREMGRFFPYEVEESTGNEVYPIPVFASMPCAGCLLEENRVCAITRRDPERLPCIDKISVEQVQAALENFL